MFMDKSAERNACCREYDVKTEEVGVPSKERVRGREEVKKERKGE